MKHQLRQWYYHICLFLGIYKREDFVRVSDIVNEACLRFNAPENPIGLCVTLRDALYIKANVSVLDLGDIPRYVHKFTPDFLDAPLPYGIKGYWWPVEKEDARQVRTEALTKLCNYYVDNDELILKGKRL